MILCPVSSLFSQDSKSDPTNYLRLAQDRQWRVRAVSAASDTTIGRVRAVGSDSVTIGSNRLPISALLQLERRSSEISLTPAAVAGAAIGGLTLLFVGPWMQGVGDVVCSSGCQVRWFAAGAAFGVIGSMVLAPGETSWIEIWRR
jgi:hypothetical protein